MAGIVERCLDESDAGVFVRDFFRSVGSGGAIMKAECAGVIVSFFRVGDFFQSVRDELIKVTNSSRRAWSILRVGR